MKRIVLILSAVATLATAASAQTRSIDWSTQTIVSPDTLYSTSTGTAFNMDFIMKNNGTDTVQVGDSILYQFAVQNQAGTQTVLVYPSATSLAVKIATRKIAPSDTMRITATLSTTVYVTTSSLIRIALISHVINRPNLPFETATSNANNTLIKNMTWFNTQRFPVGLNDEIQLASPVRVYPNPATSVINFEMDAFVGSQLSVYDLNGRVVASQMLSGGNNSVGIDNLNNGIYFYDIQTSEGISVSKGKFVVSK